MAAALTIFRWFRRKLSHNTASIGNFAELSARSDIKSQLPNFDPTLTHHASRAVISDNGPITDNTALERKCINTITTVYSSLTCEI